MKPEKEKWIADVMQSLDGIQSAQSAANMEQRILSRVGAEKTRGFSKTVSGATIWRIAAALAVIITLNVFTCVAFSKNNSPDKNLQAFAREYFITNNYNY